MVGGPGPDALGLRRWRHPSMPVFRTRAADAASTAREHRAIEGRRSRVVAPVFNHQGPREGRKAFVVGPSATSGLRNPDGLPLGAQAERVMNSTGDENVQDRRTK